MNTRTRLIGGALAVVMAMGGLAIPAMANPREDTDRALTYGLGAATALLLGSGKGHAAIVTGLGTLAAASRWQHDIDRRHRWERGWDRDDHQWHRDRDWQRDGDRRGRW